MRTPLDFGVWRHVERNIFSMGELTFTPVTEDDMQMSWHLVNRSAKSGLLCLEDGTKKPLLGCFERAHRAVLDTVLWPAEDLEGLSPGTDTESTAATSAGASTPARAHLASLTMHTPSPPPPPSGAGSLLRTSGETAVAHDNDAEERALARFEDGDGPPAAGGENGDDAEHAEVSG